jgi:hypothetical protein
MSPKTIASYGFLIGGISSLAGFVGPVIITPEANQGPLLVIFITGPLRFVLGILSGSIISVVKMKKPEFKDPLQKLLDRV